MARALGHVDEKDNISHFHLRACSLVCRFWLPSSQRRLFHHVNLNPPSESVLLAKLHAQIRRLDQVLLNSPHLTNYIIVLELPCRSSSDLPRYPLPGSPGWTVIEKPLSRLLRKLTHVQKLIISGLAWRFLTGDFRQSLFQVLELPSMEFLCITERRSNHAESTHMDDLTNFINHARGLTGLSLTYINVSRLPASLLETKQGEDDQQRFERNCIHLTSLGLRRGSDNSTFISWLLGPRSHLGVSHIHTLHIGPVNDSVAPSAAHSSTSRLSCH
ncbi:hypothetical protein JB92DRAFT_653343 [Gautieria morchelliformis]|nr:hypothetical protein JB92DRAFT_653343 [Gautieria morchelliformis]